MRRRLADRLGYTRDRGFVTLGPLVITTRSSFKASERNAVEIGYEFGRMGGQLTTRPASKRGLHVV